MKRIKIEKIKIEKIKITWTVTVELSVFAGDMDKDQVIANADQLLNSMTDGSDFISYYITNATRDEIN